MSIENLYAPLQLGSLQLPHRIVMAPLTRMRSAAGGVPTALSAEYYAQRASAALIITEATGVSVQGMGYPNMPGLYSAEQVVGWSAVTKAVHAQGGRIIAQIVHGGRTSHSSYSPEGALPVAPSALAPVDGQAFTPEFSLVPFEIPRALDIDELPGIVNDFRQAAENAMAAGFDGVEIHSANGYLLDQFLQDNSNLREDAYGGSIAGRARLLLNVVDAIAHTIGADKVGVRLSPSGNFNDMKESNPTDLFSYVIQALSERGIAYLHLIEPRASSVGLGDDLSLDVANNARLFRRLFKGPVISAGGYTAQSGSEAIAAGDADAIAYGRMFIANPDLAARFKSGAELNAYDRNTFYGGAEVGYTDYPTLASA
ncbi:alkene reductase [Pseudomonas moorei]|jgi:N-ethylmaleimide reductase|uniref:alkene reductase n=1 Tax=Pseudomonas moorei TaxID=395599 RepID=UPI0036F1D6AE